MNPTTQKSMVCLVLVLFILFPAAVTPDGESSRLSISLSGCPDKCGNVSIPYPFGIGAQCAAASLSSYFILTCNDTFHPPHPTVGDHEGQVEITDISLEHGEMRVLSPVNHICFSSNTTTSAKLTRGYDLRPTPFLPSPSRNRFTVIGCNTLVAEVGWYSFRQQDLVGHLGFIDDKAKRAAPIVADWAIRNGSCPEEGKEPLSGYACVSANSYCMSANNGPGYLCQCSKGYKGNPYIQNGC